MENNNDTTATVGMSSPDSGLQHSPSMAAASLPLLDTQSVAPDPMALTERHLEEHLRHLEEVVGDHENEDGVDEMVEALASLNVDLPREFVVKMCGDGGVNGMLPLARLLLDTDVDGHVGADVAPEDALGLGDESDLLDGAAGRDEQGQHGLPIVDGQLSGMGEGRQCLLLAGARHL
jgi:hypothetical protein